jgi:hypothetical protein
MYSPAVMLVLQQHERTSLSMNMCQLTSLLQHGPEPLEHHSGLAHSRQAVSGFTDDIMCFVVAGADACVG